MGRKRRRRQIRPPQEPVGADPLGDLINELFRGLCQQTLKHIAPATPMFQPKSQDPVKDAEVISVRTEK